MNRFFITADTHGSFTSVREFSKIAETTVEDVLVIAGDAGINYFRNDRDRRTKEIISKIPITLFCVRGNHEERPSNIETMELKSMFGNMVYYEKEYPNILYAKDADIYNFNGKRVLTIGGAYSVDKDYRLSRGWSWFPDEQLSPNEMSYLIRNIDYGIFPYEYDIVISHTCPLSWVPRDLFIPSVDQSTVDNNMEIFLEDLIDRISFSNYYYGHYHGNRVTFLPNGAKVRMIFEEYHQIA